MFVIRISDGQRMAKNGIVTSINITKNFITCFNKIILHMFIYIYTYFFLFLNVRQGSSQHYHQRSHDYELMLLQVFTMK